jgi:hypothetical protein
LLGSVPFTRAETSSVPVVSMTRGGALTTGVAVAVLAPFE